MVLSSIIGMMTGPGQTIGVSVFVDPMIAGLDLTRSEVSTAYMVGTLTAAFGLPFIGRYLDTQGLRKATGIAGITFGLFLFWMAGVRGLITLAIGFIGIRMLGQGGLTITSSTAPARWFDRRRGLAIGVTTSAGAAATAIFPLVSTAMIVTIGWRSAWAILGIAVWAVVLPIAHWGLIDDPRDVGQHPDGMAPRQRARTDHRTDDASREADDTTKNDVSFDADYESEISLTNAQAMRTPIFWAVTSAVISASMITTALNFHQISILSEQGLTSIQAAANFVPQTVAGLTISLWVGSLIDRLRQRALLVGMLGLLCTTMLYVSHVTPGLSAIAYGIVFGSTQGAMRSIESASYPKLFGPKHAGEIRGVSRAISVAASALGPLVLSLGFQFTGSYRQVLTILLVLPVTVAVFALLAPEPRRRVPKANDAI